MSIRELPSLGHGHGLCMLHSLQEVTVANNPVSEDSEARFTGRDCPGALLRITKSNSTDR